MNLNNVLNKLGYTLYNNSFHKKKFVSVNSTDIFDRIILKHMADDFFFVQIGANDGVRNDPIYHKVKKYKLKGIVIEPIPDLYEKLKDNYKDSNRILPLNLAIHKDKKQAIMYQIDPSVKEYGDRYQGTPSLFRSHHEKKNIKNEHIIEVPVKCISFNELLDKYNITKIDLLQIDTEGYDYEIVKMIDFSKVKPKIISFEHGITMGIMSYNQLLEVQKILMDEGYKVLIDEIDVRAYL